MDFAFCLHRPISKDRSAANQLQGAESGETGGVLLDGAPNRFEVTSVVVDQEHVSRQGRGGDHRVCSPVREALLAGFYEH